jgi:hypothetical protein
MQDGGQGRVLVRAIRTSAISILAIGLLAGSAVGVAGVDAESCGFISVEELDGFGGLRVSEQMFASADRCGWNMTDDAGGSHYVSVGYPPGVLGSTLEELRPMVAGEDNEVIEVDVAGQAGFAVAGYGAGGHTLFFPLGDSVVGVTVSSDGPAEAVELDQVAHADTIAEAVVARALAGGGPPLTKGPKLPDIEGFTYRGGRGFAGADVEAEAGEGDLLMLTPLVEATGVTLDRTAFRTGIITDDDGRVGEYWILQVTGSDAASLVPVLVEFLRGQIPDEVSAAEAEIAGQPVTSMDAGEFHAIFHGNGDKLYVLAMPDEAAAMIIEALP